jgi:hypothetical protein
VEQAVALALAGAAHPLPSHAGGEMRVQLIGKDGDPIVNLKLAPNEPDGEMFDKESLMRGELDTLGHEGAVAAGLIAKLLWSFDEATPQLVGLRRAILGGLPIGSTIVSESDGGEIKAKA